MLDITTQIRRYSRREREKKGKRRKKKKTGLLKREREEKRVEVRKKEGENLGIIGYVERTKATVDNVASASAISISRFSFFEKRKIYIYI